MAKSNKDCGEELSLGDIILYEVCLDLTTGILLVGLSGVLLVRVVGVVRLETGLLEVCHWDEVVRVMGRDLVDDGRRGEEEASPALSLCF